MGADLPWVKKLPSKEHAFLLRIFAGVEALCADYIDDLEKRRIEAEEKIVQDSLWGFIEFQRAEVVLIDSPLVQRLRSVRQLGFAHLLFPNAGYSRFEHSLGVCHVVGEFAKRLRARKSRSGDQSTEVAEDDIKILRLAALLHDVGHIAFSHTSERCIEKFRGFRSFLYEFRQVLKGIFRMRDKAEPAELLSVAVCSSPTVRKMISIALGDIVADKAVEQICQCILGAAQTEKNWFLTEMISGDMDADKLDYIPRDCMVTGVPLPFDVKRLILKACLARGKDPEVKQVRLAVSFTGARALMDLTVSRMMLREKIYKHPKVAAAESMFENALSIASRVRSDLIRPENFLILGDAVLLGQISNLN